MPRRKDIKKVLVIGSGPIVIGQAAEFDYAGTQACLALKEEGYEVILANSNPATIMTDTHIADKVYMEPLTLEYVAKIIRFERPDAIVPGLGGQTGLNLAVQLAKKGILKECQVEILGTSFESIERAEDRELFKELCESLGEPVLPSHIAMSIEEAVAVAEEIGYPVVLRPAFTLGGTGGGFADDETELREMMRNALSLSPVHQVLVEKSIKGYKEIEYEVMRDRNDTAICICCMENIDPVGIHTGDSIVVAPSQTLTNKEFQMLRDSALKIIRELKIEGGCNVQFALDPLSFKYYLIEVNPRVSRSSALASKASGYPIARVSAKIAVGLTLDEIRIANTPASFEPTLDYIVTKVARFPFDKFSDASNKLGTQMKATGEVMSIGRTMEESLLKAVRSLETDLRQDEDRHVLPGEVQEHRRVRKRRPRTPDGRRDAPRCQAHGFKRQVHRSAVGPFAERNVPSAREEQRLPGLQDDRHLRQRIRLLRALFLLDLRGGKRVDRQREREDHRARFRPDPHRPGRRIRLLDRARHLVDPCGGLRGHHHQQQPRDRLDRLHHQRQALLRAADRGGCDERHPSRETEGHRGVARRTDGHQPRRTARRAGRAHHRHGHAGDQER